LAEIGIAVVWDHRRDARRRGAAQRVDQQQQLHQVLVHRRAGRLNDEHIRAAHILLDLDARLAIAKGSDDRAPEVHVDAGGDRLCQRPVGVATEDL
jgi:hypothetical protein